MMKLSTSTASPATLRALWTCCCAIALSFFLSSAASAAAPQDPKPGEEPAEASASKEPKKKDKKEKGSESSAEDEKEEESVLAIRGADVYVGDGTILRRATVVVRDDKIEAVGRDIEVPEEAEVIDASGKVLSPGFVAVRGSGFGAPSTFNVEEIKDSINPFDPTIKIGLGCGITSFGMLADEGRDAPKAKSAVLKLLPESLDGFICESGGVVSMRVPLSPKQWRDFRQNVKKAREFIEKRDNPPKEEKKDEAKKDEKKKAPAPTTRGRRGRRGRPSGASGGGRTSAKTPKPPRGAETYVALLDRKKTLWVLCGGGGGRRFRGPSRGGPSDDNDKLRQALDIAEELGVGVVLERPVTAWVHADRIARAGATVILSPRDRKMADEGNPDNTGSNLAAAAILVEAGVPVAVAAPSPRLNLGGTYGQDLSTPHIDAAYAVRGGLDNRKALRTITLDAARALGADDRIGSIEVGKDADLLILDGDPLHYRTLVETAIVNGTIAYEREKEPFFRHIQR